MAVKAIAAACRAVLCLGALGAAAMLASPAQAGKTWDGLKAEVFAGRAINDGRGIVSLKAPTRPDDQRAVPVSVDASFADGRTIRSVTIVVDENPSPVAAVLRLGEGRDKFHFASKFRFNSETEVRAVVEASDGQLYMVEQLVKFAGGQAACSAPPTGDPQEIAANMGKMQLAELPEKTAASQINRRAKLEVRHPNHTGMVLDQLTLLYIPLRMVSRLEMRQGDDTVLELDGSITLSENPAFEFDYRVNGAPEMKVVLKDSDGAQWVRSFPIGQGS